MIFRKFIRSLSPLRAGYLLGTILPGALLLITLGLMRAAHSHASPGAVGGQGIILGSQLFLVLGLALGGLASLNLPRRARNQRLMLVAWQVIWLLVGSIELIAHQFFITTGSTLDYYLLAFSLQHLADNADVIGSEVPLWIYGVMPAFVLWVLTAPWIIAHKSDAANEHAGAFAKEMKESPGGRPVRDALMLVAAVAFLGATALPLFSASGVSAARSPTTTMVLSAVEALQFSRLPPASARATALHTRLEIADKTQAKSGDARRNLVFLVLESTRASATSIHNPSLETTPFLADLAARSTVAAHAYAMVPHSSKALVAILCGIEPNLRMPVTEAIPGHIPGRCLAELLGEQGYQTAFFQSARGSFENRKQLVDNMGYDDFIPGEKMDPSGFSKANYFGYEDDIMLKPSRKWLISQRNKPFFATYFTLTPHHPYLAPTRYGRHNFAENDTLNRYLNSVHYVDHFIKNIFAQYKALGLYEDTIFVLVGDHGEGLGEHGRFQHDNVIYQEGIHIPMLVFDPQDPKPRRIESNVNHLDLLPTALKRLGFEVLGGSYPGTPLLEAGRERPIHVYCWYERSCMARILDGQKYIHHFGSQPDEFFDLRDDPGEKKNLAKSRPDLGAWRRDLMTWRRRNLGIHENIAKQGLEGVVFETRPPLEHPLDAQFGDEARLHGYDISARSVAPGGSLTITWYFESLAEIDPNWQLFVHVGHKGANKGFDHTPAEGLMPLQDWEPGTFISDTHTITIPEHWTAGKITVYLGLWNAKTHKRKVVSGAIKTDGRNRAQAFSVPIEAKKTPKKLAE